MPKTLHILQTRFTTPLPQTQWNSLLASLPSDHQTTIKRFHFWQDQHRALFGKLLLIRGLQSIYGIKNPDLSQLQVTDYGRISLPGQPDFNISHSGDYVLCGFSAQGRIGVDVEEVRPVDLNDFTGVMTPAQMEMIYAAPDQIQAFFRLWTLKESAIKANGKGLSIPLNELETDFQTVSVEDDTWHLQELQLDDRHCGFVATEVPDYKVEMIEVNPLEFEV